MSPGSISAFSDADYRTTQALCRNGRFAEAAALLKQRHGAAGDNPWVLGAMALLSREQGAYSEALSWADLAAKFGLDMGVGQAEAGFALLALSRFEEAIPGLSDAMRFEAPFAADARLRFAEALFDRGQIAQAFACLAEGAWSDTLANDALALAFACTLLDENLGLEPHWARQWTADEQAGYGLQQASSLMRAVALRRWDEARVISERLLRLVPELAEGLVAVGAWRFHQHRFGEADRLLGEAEYRKPDEPRAAIYRPLVLYRLGHLKEAVQRIERLPAERVNAHLGGILADCYRRLGNRGRARAIARAQLDKDPSASIAQSVLWRLQKGDKRRAACNEARVGLAANPANAAAGYFLADEIWATDRATASAIARRALEADPSLAAAAEWTSRLDKDASSEAQPSALSLVGLYAPKPGAGSGWPSQEQTEILQLALEPDVDIAARWASWSAGRDIRDLDAGLYRLLPLVYRRLAEADLKNTPHFQLLGGIWRKMHYENYNRWRKILPAIDALLAAGIPVMPLKGGLFGEALYGSWGNRPMADIDVLVPMRYAVRAHELLIDNGLTPSAPLYDVRLRFHYALTYKEPSGSYLDLHWRPMEEMVSPAYDDNVVWAGSEPLRLFNRDLVKPTPTFQVVHAIVHGLRWNDMAPVRWIPDALLLLRVHGTTIDWGRAEELARRFLCLLPLQKGLRYLLDNFSFDHTLVLGSNILEAVPDPIETPLLNVRLGANRRRCSHLEMIALVDLYSAFVRASPGTALVLIGGANGNITRAWSVRNKIFWFAGYRKAEIVGALRAGGFQGGHIINGDYNGVYIYQGAE